MTIERAKAINGWMTELELLWLAEQAEKYDRIVEIGCYRGRSTRALADNTKGVVIAIDHWNGEPQIAMNEKERSQLYNDFCINLADLIEQKKVYPFKMHHEDVTKCAERFCTPSMVFIDGSHQYADVKRDVAFWMEMLKANGNGVSLLCGHDVDYEPVAKALEELVPDYHVVVKTSLWYAHV